MSVIEQERPKIQEAYDAIIRVIRSCVCGSDLWAYSAGDSKQKHSINDGHEAIGIVEEVGESVTTGSGQSAWFSRRLQRRDAQIPADAGRRHGNRLPRR